jgi:hypothetical protein
MPIIGTVIISVTDLVRFSFLIMVPPGRGTVIMVCRLGHIDHGADWPGDP